MQGVKHWNKPPSALIESATLKIFKSKLDEYLSERV